MKTSPRQFVTPIALLLLMCAAPLAGWAQMVVQSGLPLATYMQTFTGAAQGVTISNVVFSGTPNQIGQFTVTNNNPGLAMQSGIILSSGNATSAPGPNTSGSISGAGQGGGTDPQLNTITGNLNDIAYLQFDFIPLGDTARFNFVFASDEYNEFANSNFNDAFGFFVNGPGYPGWTNRALLPGTATPVTINNVNLVNNPQFYQNNDNGGSPNFQWLQYDGHTFKLEVIIPVQPCQQYSLKIAIADVFDGSYDSAVFLEAGSFNITGIQSSSVGNVDASGNTYAYEGCSDAAFVLVRDTSLSDTLILATTGSAIPGVDYLPLPDTIIFTPGNDTIVIPVYPMFDGITEITETVSLIVPTVSICNPTGVSLDTVSILIYNVDTFSINLPDTLVSCNGDVIPFAAGVTGGISVLPNSYEWYENGVLISPDSAFNYTVSGSTTLVFQVTEPGCSTPPATDTVVIVVGSILNPLLVTVSNDTTVCEDDAVTLTAAPSGGSGIYTYEWTFNGTPVGTSASLTVTPTVGISKYYVLVDDSCVTVLDSVVIYVDPRPSADFGIQPAACIGEVVTVSFLGAPAIGLQYEWTFTGNATPSAAFGPNDQTVSWQSPGFKEITLLAYTAACTTSVTDTINITTQPVVNAGPDAIVCALDSLTLQGTSNQADLTGCTITWTASTGTNPDAGTLTPVVTPAVATDYILTVECGICVSLTDTVHIDVHTLPTLTFNNPTPAFCAGDTGVVIAGNATGGTGSGTYSFQWSPVTGLADPFSASTNAAPTATTMYTLVVTDANGCNSLGDSVLVTVNPLPIPNAGPDQFTCNQNPVMLMGSATGGSGTYSFEWTPADHLDNPNSATPIATPDTSITYTLSVTDDVTGCVNTISDPISRVTVHVVSPTQAEAGLANVTICNGDSILIGHPTLGTQPHLFYFWTPNTDLSNPNSGFTWAYPTTTTTYVLNQILGACPGMPDTVTVTVLDAPLITLTDPQGPFCPGSTFAPQYTLTGGVAPLNFDWQPASAMVPGTAGPLPMFMADTAYTLTLTVTDAQGCEATTAALVDVFTPPAISAGPDQNYCVTAFTTGVELQGDFAGAAATWLAPINLAISNPLVNPAQTEQYVLRAVYGNNCEVMDTTTVYVLPGIVPTISASDSVVCSGTSVWLTATGGVGAATFQWSPAAGLSNPNSAVTLADPQAVSFGDSVTYTVTVSEGGCTADTSITLYVMPTPVVNFLPGATSLCLPAAEIRFGNMTQNGLIYEWDFDDGTTDNAHSPTHSFPDAGQYIVTLTAWSDSAQTCFAQFTYPIAITIHDSIVAEIASTPLVTDTIWLPNGEVEFTDQSMGSVQSFWDFGDGQSGVGGIVTHEYQAEGEYTVTLIAVNAGGCRDTVTAGPYLVDEEFIVPIPNIFTPNGDGFNDGFNVGYSGSEDFSVTVSDRWGVPVYQSTNPNQEWFGTFNGGDVPTGTYYYQVVIGNRILTGSVMLVR